MSAKGLAARLAATQLLFGVLFQKKSTAEILAAPQNPLTKLSPQDRARAQSLTLGTLRYLGPIDEILADFLDKPPPPKVQNTLRLATYEMLHDLSPAHGVVNAAVEIVRGSAKAGKLAGMANAVLRRLAEVPPERLRDAPAQQLPSWLAKPIAKTWGADAVDAIADAHLVGAAIDLTLNADTLADVLAEDLDAVRLPGGSFRLKGRPQISALPGFDEGAWWVQDAAAALPVRVLGDIAGKTVLDICAAPGGKTLQLAAAGAKVTALDISEKRLERLAENLRRTELKAQTVTADFLNWNSNQHFDVQLLDAPCSATGTIRRHPDLPFAKDGQDLSSLFSLQEAMLDKAISRMQAGQRLVYCTCSLLPKEGEMQIEAALARHDDLKVLPIDPGMFGLPPEAAAPHGALRTRPDFWADIGGMDGFYIAILSKGIA